MVRSLRGTSFFAVIIILLSLCMAGQAGAININGYEFDDSSATLTNKWFPMAVGDSYVLSADEGNLTSTGELVEDVYGVNCLRIKESINGETTAHGWYAQDTAGNIHCFKELGGDGDTFEVDEDMDIPNIFMPADPSLGDTWNAVVSEKKLKNTVVSDSETVGTYGNCLKVKIEDDDGSNYFRYYYFASEVGLVQIDVEGVTLSRGSGGGAGAININGYGFDDSSATLTNKWFPMSVGDSHSLSGNGMSLTDTAELVEEVYGVNCLRVKGSANGEIIHTWYAQDTAGNIHCFKELEEGDTFEVDEDMDIPNIFMPANPSLGDTWNAVVSQKELKNTVVSDSETVGTYGNCLKVKIEDDDGSDFFRYYYFASEVGLVQIDVEGATLSRGSGGEGGGDEGGGGGCFISSLRY